MFGQRLPRRRRPDATAAEQVKRLVFLNARSQHLVHKRVVARHAGKLLPLDAMHLFVQGRQIGAADKGPLRLGTNIDQRGTRSFCQCGPGTEGRNVAFELGLRHFLPFNVALRNQQGGQGGQSGGFRAQHTRTQRHRRKAAA